MAGVPAQTGKTLSNNGIQTGQTIEALQVSQSVDAFTGADEYDITISGSLEITGSLLTTGSVVFKQVAENQTNTAYGIVLVDPDGQLYSGSSSGLAGEKGEEGAQGSTGFGDKGEKGSVGQNGDKGA